MESRLLAVSESSRQTEARRFQIMKPLKKRISSNAIAVALLTVAAFGLWQAVPSSPAEAAPAVDHSLVPVSTPASFAASMTSTKRPFFESLSA